jgi:hypothetical protein
LNKNIIIWGLIAVVLIAILNYVPIVDRFYIWPLAAVGIAIMCFRLIQTARGREAWHRKTANGLAPLQFIYLAMAFVVAACVWVAVGFALIHSPTGLVFYAIFPAGGLGFIAIFCFVSGYYYALSGNRRD